MPPSTISGRKPTPRAARFRATARPPFRTVERQALALLVYRGGAVQSAEKLGVPVTEAEVTSRMTSATEESEGSTAFARDTVRAQIAYEHIYSKVTSNAVPARRAQR